MKDEKYATTCENLLWDTHTHEHNHSYSKSKKSSSATCRDGIFRNMTYAHMCMYEFPQNN